MTEDFKLVLPLASDVDVSNMDFMPLHDQKLMKSRAWLRAKNWRGGGPGLAFALINLWCAAFRSVPAGSLDSDDEMLADAARVDIEFWALVKDKALEGWESHGGRMWHPVVAAAAQNLWETRMRSRWVKAWDSWRAAAKRATDKGREPPDPPGDFGVWLQAEQPATAAYLAAGMSAERPPDISECRNDIEPKRSEGKDHTPLTPQAQVAGPEGQEAGRRPAGTGWFVGELARLEREFGGMTPLLKSQLQRPDAPGHYALVETFKGCWLAKGHGNRPELLMPSKRRADAVNAAHGDWIKQYWPDLRVRHASADESRRAKALGMV